jgi:hypothetical protein
MKIQKDLNKSRKRGVTYLDRVYYQSNLILTILGLNIKKPVVG